MTYAGVPEYVIGPRRQILAIAFASSETGGAFQCVEVTAPILREYLSLVSFEPCPERRSDGNDTRPASLSLYVLTSDLVIAKVALLRLQSLHFEGPKLAEQAQGRIPRQPSALVLFCRAHELATLSH